MGSWMRWEEQQGQRLMDGGQESHMGTENSINNSGCVWVPYVDQESLRDQSQSLSPKPRFYDITPEVDLPLPPTCVQTATYMLP